MPVKTFLLGVVLATGAIANAQVRAVGNPSPNEKTPVRSPAIDAGDYIYISGQGPHRSDGTIPGDFDAQASQSLENIKAILAAAGLNLENVVYVQVYLEDINQYDRLNNVFAKYFPKTPPARAVLGVAKVPQGSIEITAVASTRSRGTKSRHSRKLQIVGAIFLRRPHPRSFVRLRHAGPRSEIRGRPRRSRRAN